MWDDQNVCLSWDDTKKWADNLSMPMLQILYRGQCDEKMIRGLEIDTSCSEGYVVRDVNSFCYSDFQTHVAKWVCKAHVTDAGEHWMHKTVVANKLRST